VPSDARPPRAIRMPLAMAAGRLTARSDADLIQASKRCDRKRRRQAESPREASARDRGVAALLFAFKLR
jgi:hypothetical protein